MLKGRLVLVACMVPSRSVRVKALVINFEIWHESWSEHILAPTLMHAAVPISGRSVYIIAGGADPAHILASHILVP